MKTPKQNPDERLSQLLKLKKQEKPDAEFWEEFDQNLRSRQLSALVRTQSWSERAWKLASIIARKSAPTVATASAFTLAFFAVNNTEFFVDKSAPQAPASTLVQSTEPAPVFVVESNIEVIEDSVDQTLKAHQVYTVQALTSDKSNERYNLISAPKSFTATTNAGETGSFGAMVIRTSNQF